jgi:hypothetical protein
MIDKLFEWLFAVIVVLALLPCLVRIVVQTLGPILLLAAIVGLVIGAYRSLERSRPRGTASRSSGGGSERTPILPSGGD